MQETFHCNNYRLQIGLIILGHFYDEKCLKPLIYKGLSQTTYNQRRIHMSKLKVMYEGILELANCKIPCYVLEDGTRVLSGDK